MRDKGRARIGADLYIAAWEEGKQRGAKEWYHVPTPHARLKHIQAKLAELELQLFSFPGFE